MKRLPDWAWPVLAFVALIVLWDVSIRVFALKPFILPSPASVAQALVADWQELADATLYTLVEIVLGFALSVIVGVGLAVAIVTWRPLEKAIYPILVGAQVIPKVAIEIGQGLIEK